MSKSFSVSDNLGDTEETHRSSRRIRMSVSADGSCKFYFALEQSMHVNVITHHV